MGLTRRVFLGALATAAMAKGVQGQTAGKAAGANERIRLGVAGLRWRGWDLARTVAACPDAEVAALCDVDGQLLETRIGEALDLTGARPKAYRDYRNMLADDAIDAVMIAMPNHWHVLAAIWALDAGKDVYVEKPLSHTIWEGRQLVSAAARSGRVVQHGTQRRSEPAWIRTMERIRNGVIGDVYMVRGTVGKRRDAFCLPWNEAPPPTLDWTLWQGPATERAFSRNYVHYNWHWFWHYGNGELGNNGVHRADLINWGLDKGHPVEVSATGGIFGYDGPHAGETPNVMSVNYTYADGTLATFSICGRPTPTLPMITFYGSEGYMEDFRAFDMDGKEIPDEAPPKDENETKTHVRRFIDAVKARDPQAVASTVEQGHVAATFSHLGNISYRLGRSLRFDPETERFVGDDEANAFLRCEYRPGYEVPELT